MMKEEFLSKVKILRGILEHKGKKGLIISDFANLCWLGVRRPHILSLSESSVVAIVITLKDVYLTTNNIEIDRILDEEISPSVAGCLQPRIHQWYAPPFYDKKDGYINALAVEDEIKHYRMIMTERELAEAKLLGQDIAAIVEHTLPLIKADKTERHISSQMAKICLEKEIDIGLVICASQKRIHAYRHPITTATPIGNQCLLALTVRRNGIYSCISRMVSLAKPDEALMQKRNAVLAVDCACQKYTQIGRNICDVFEKIKEVYAQAGFKDEWKNHHQGGITGYKSREEKINQSSDITIKNHMLFAYNPSVCGYKTEDSFYMKDGKANITTLAEKLPMIEIEFEGEKYNKPDIIRLD